MTEKKRDQVGLVLKRLDHMMRRNLSMHVKEAGIDEITLMHGWIIRYLYENRDRDIFQKDIDKHFSVGRASVTNVIQLMEKKGYLRRESVDYDARLKKVLLTEKGIYTHEKIEGIISGLNVRTLEGISDEELDAFFIVTEKLEKNLIKQKELFINKEERDDSDITERSKRI